MPQVCLNVPIEFQVFKFIMQECIDADYIVNKQRKISTQGIEEI